MRGDVDENSLPSDNIKWGIKIFQCEDISFPKLNCFLIYYGNGNNKLGKGIGMVNRMSGETCPGESDACRLFCYAKKGFYPTKFARYRAETITLPDTLPKYFPWHTSGDFDSVEYIDWVIEVVRHHPDTQFWAYTRGWPVPMLLSASRTTPGRAQYGPIRLRGSQHG